MDTGFLEQLGLSRNEAKAYLALLRLGKANSAELARESGIHRINVYDVLNSLISKGLVSYFNESGARVFKAENPERLKETLQGKLVLLEENLPELLKEFSARKESYDVVVLRGIEGKKAQFEEILRIAHNTTNRVFIPHGLTSLEQQPYKTMLHKWIEKLASQNVEYKTLLPDTPQARKRAKIFNDIKTYRTRFSKEIESAPVSWDVIGDLLFLTFHTEPFLIIRVKSKEIADVFKNSFEIIWKTARK